MSLACLGFNVETTVHTKWLNNRDHGAVAGCECTPKAATAILEPRLQRRAARWSSLKDVSQVRERERANSIEALMTTLTRSLLHPFIEAESVMFHLCSRDDMKSSCATRNSGMQFAVSYGIDDSH